MQTLIDMTNVLLRFVLGVRPSENSYTMITLHAERTNVLKHLELDISYEW
jgi:hypothetical protein